MARKNGMLIAKEVKKYIHTRGYRSTNDTIHVLNKRIERLIEDAMERCRLNSRKTIRPSDF